MKEINPSEKIIELLGSKKFESLSQEEKSAVLAEMDKAEYNHLYELHHQLKTALQANSFSPGENLKNKLMASFDTHHSSGRNKKSRFRFLYLRVPLYQPIAAAFMVLLFLTAVYFLSDFSTVTNERIVYKYLTDTVYVKPEIAKQADTYDNTSITKIEKENSVIEATTTFIQKKNKTEIPVTVKLCRSIKADNALKQFMVSL